ncbi:SRPBCC family protein [Aeromicrobium sp. Marseille-Q0843]|uniref:SRPBCC family protein n=1 Tax=Aeromicrobium phoceense TaxID=2754045 RepID=A0A838XMQ6_9ACTN|nr:SRPBCC family protein [Aeromicrobium phoceense]MBA4608264.1 SRPBCC family protein [Aeromicrobium phoceense]
MESRHVSRVIAASPQDVYAFAVEPANLPRWASGLAEAEVEVRDDHLVVQSPMGEVRVRFVPRNSFGILDHDVTLPSGATVTNPFRVLAHPDGAEVVFTVRQLDLSDEEFEQDARTIAKDLDALAALVES